MKNSKHALGLAGLLSVLGYEAPSKKSYVDYNEISAGDKAVIITGAEVKDEERPFIHNSFWVYTAQVYHELLKNGYKPENIFVLYLDGKPVLDDPVMKGKEGELEMEFNGSYNNIATAENVKALLNDLENTIKPEERFTVYFMQHGSASPWGKIGFEHDHSSMRGYDLDTILEGNQSEQIMVVVNSCYSESFTKNIKHKAITISSTKEGEEGAGNREYSFAVFFSEEMNNPKNDADKNGTVSPEEAFQTAKVRNETYLRNLEESLKEDPEGLEEFSWVGFTPTYRENK